MSKVTPLIKWFVINDGSYICSKRVDFLDDNRVVFHFIDKTAFYKTGYLVLDMQELMLEGWQSADLIWVDEHYGHWYKSFEQKFYNLKILDNKQDYNKEDGKIQIVTLRFERSEVKSKFNNDKNINKEFLELKNTTIQMPVKYNAMNGKPIQSVLDPHVLEKHYSKN